MTLQERMNAKKEAFESTLPAEKRNIMHGPRKTYAAQESWTA